MRARKWTWILAAVLVIAAGAGMWFAMPLITMPSAKSSMPKAPKTLTLTSLQVMATDSCKCARTATDESGRKACWADFDKAILPGRRGNTVTPCGSLSPQFVRPDAARDGDIIAGFGTNWDQTWICTKDEARVTEGAIARAYDRRARGLKTETDDEIIERIGRAFASGEQVNEPADERGCSSHLD